MTATNSPSHSIQINNFNKNNINVGGKTNLNKYQKDSKKNSKNPTNNISNKVSNNINNNENAQNLLMDSNKNDISGITYDNILSKDIINSNDNLDPGTSLKDENFEEN